jgi:DNA-binding NarL/FixJ family response regulator
MEIDMKHTENSILIVTQNPAFAKNIGAFFPEGDDIHVATKASSFSAMNGSGGDLTFQNDIVIFDADPDNAEEVAAIADLLKLRADSTLFLALTGNDVSIAKAQKLREAGVDEVLPQSISAVELRSVIDNALKKPAIRIYWANNTKAERSGKAKSLPCPRRAAELAPQRFSSTLRTAFWVSQVCSRKLPNTVSRWWTSTCNLATQTSFLISKTAAECFG